MTAEDQKNRLNKDQISVEQIRLNRKLDHNQASAVVADV